MARYTSLLTVGLPMRDLQPLLNETLKSCNLEIIYATEDYLMARENPGQVAFPKLVTVEVLIDKTTATEREVRMNLVMKNEELPLQVENHCRKMFNLVNQTISDNKSWNLIETVTG